MELIFWYRPQAEIVENAAFVMAGVKPHESYIYFLMRMFIGMPIDYSEGRERSVNEVTERLVGREQLAEWRQQQQDPHQGDNTRPGKHFFERLLPFITEVIVQDGIYFIVEFPDHFITNLLLVCFATLVCESLVQFLTITCFDFAVSRIEFLVMHDGRPRREAGSRIRWKISIKMK